MKLDDKQSSNQSVTQSSRVEEVCTTDTRGERDRHGERERERERGRGRTSTTWYPGIGKNDHCSASQGTAA